MSVHLSLTAFACVSISQMYKYWTVVATDMTEKDARTYVRMNWRDMRPKSVALTVRLDPARLPDGALALVAESARAYIYYSR